MAVFLADIIRIEKVSINKESDGLKFLSCNMSVVDMKKKLVATFFATFISNNCSMFGQLLSYELKKYRLIKKVMDLNFSHAQYVSS